MSGQKKNHRNWRVTSYKQFSRPWQTPTSDNNNDDTYMTPLGRFDLDLQSMKEPHNLKESFWKHKMFACCHRFVRKVNHLHQNRLRVSLLYHLAGNTLCFQPGGWNGHFEATHILSLWARNDLGGYPCSQKRCFFWLSQFSKLRNKTKNVSLLVVFISCYTETQNECSRKLYPCETVVLSLSVPSLFTKSTCTIFQSKTQVIDSCKQNNSEFCFCDFIPVLFGGKILPWSYKKQLSAFNSNQNNQALDKDSNM